MRTLPALALSAVVFAAVAAVAPAKTSHEGWPKINGIHFRNASDRNVIKKGTSKSDELLGGHGNDQLYGEAASDVIWGDYKPSGQSGSQFDHLYGGDGNDFIYASHGQSTIDAGPGDDYVKAHYGRGKIDCGAGNDKLYISHKAQKKYKITGCELISHKSDNG
jgi:Ca2+-binding RTX toxin-like protein